MKLKNWIKKIEIAGSLDNLVEIREALENDPDLDDEMREEVEQKIKEKEDHFIATTKKRKSLEDSEKQTEKVKLFDSKLYDRNTEDDKPSFSVLLDKGMGINDFLKEIMYSEFIRLPESELQMPICMAISYLNSMTVPDTISFPLIYIYSPEEESGKSQLAYHWSDFYPPDYRVHFREDITGAGLRNRLTPVANLDQPCICVLDNFNAKSTKERMGVIGWSSLLSYNRLESQAQVVADTEGGLVEFNTHCLKVFTSITPLGNTVEQSSELKSRCITIYANKDRKGVNLSRSSYNWEGLQKHYYQLWSDADRCNRVFKKGLIKDLLQMDHKKLPFHNRKWQISMILMACGVYGGVWSSLEDAITHMAKYWDWVSGKKSNKMSPLETVVYEYISNHSKLVDEHLSEIEGTRRRQELFHNHIRLSDLYSHLKELSDSRGFSEIRKNNVNDTMISNIFYNLGFVSDMEYAKSGKPLGMYFYKQ